MKQPTLNQMNKKASLWFWQSNSGQTTELHIVYPGGLTICNNTSHNLPDEWVRTAFVKADYLNDYFNNFEFVGWL